MIEEKIYYPTKQNDHLIVLYWTTTINHPCNQINRNILPNEIKSNLKMNMHFN